MVECLVHSKCSVNMLLHLSLFYAYYCVSECDKVCMRQCSFSVCVKGGEEDAGGRDAAGSS